MSDRIFTIKNNDEVIINLNKDNIGDWIIKNKDLFKQADISIWASNSKFPNGVKLTKEKYLELLNDNT